MKTRYSELRKDWKAGEEERTTTILGHCIIAMRGLHSKANITALIGRLPGDYFHILPVARVAIRHYTIEELGKISRLWLHNSR